jgi:hypothetical protein
MNHVFLSNPALLCILIPMTYFMSLTTELQNGTRSKLKL